MLKLASWLVGACVALSVAAQAFPPLQTPIAIQNVTVTTEPGKQIENATILIRDGAIVAVGQTLTLPPGTRLIDGKGEWAYPGFIDPYSRIGVADPRVSEDDELRLESRFPEVPDGPVTRMWEANRKGVAPHCRAEELVTVVDDTFEKAREAGFTTALLAPPTNILGGSAALMELHDGPTRDAIVVTDVMQTGRLAPPPARAIEDRGMYPGTLLGAIAQARQALLDTKWQMDMQAYVRKFPEASAMFKYDADLDALAPLVKGERRIAFEADSADEIGRVLNLVDEFGLKAVIVGGANAWETTDRLKKTDTWVLVSLDFGEKIKEYEFEPEDYAKAADDESLYGEEWEDRPFLPSAAYEEAERKRQERVDNAAKLEAAGVRWAFTTFGTKEPSVALKSAEELVEGGVDAGLVLRGLTVAPAALTGTERILGRLAPGMRGNVTLLTEPLGEEHARVSRVVIDGREFEFDVEKHGKPDEPNDVDNDDDDDIDDAGGDDDAAEEMSGDETEQVEDPLLDVRGHEPQWAVETDEDRKPRVQTGGNVLLKNAYVIPVVGDDMPNADILIRDGKIKQIGQDIAAPSGVAVIDVRGRVAMPGIVDPHSHIAIAAVNEGSMSVVPEVRVGDVIVHDDISIYHALAGGVTTIHTMHGSANPIGGQNAILKMRYGRPASELFFDGAHKTVKFALGENVINPGKPNPRPWSCDCDTPRRFPATRLGVEATLRRALMAGRVYARQCEGAKAPGAAPVRRDLRLEALAGILSGDIWINCHCYRADEILRLLAVAEDFGVRVAVLHHCLEAYRIMPEILRHGCGTATFADWWAYKVEAYDAVPHNAAMLLRAGVNSTVKSDSADLMRHMNVEAAKSMRYGGLTPNEALRLITINAARLFGLQDRVGSLEVGKDGDVAIFSGHPLDTFARCEMTLVDGEVYFQHESFDVDHPEQGRTIKRFDAYDNGKAGLWLPEDEAAAYDNMLRELTKPGVQPFEIPNAIALRGATLHPISGPAIENGVLVMRDGEIAAMGAEGDVPLNSAMQIIDVRGMHVWPGLINAATQLGLNEIGQVEVTKDAFESGEFQPDLLGVSGFNPHSAMIGVARADGILSAVIAASQPMVPGRAGFVELSGWTMNEMLRASDVGLIVNLPSKPPKPLTEKVKSPFEEEEEDKPDENEPLEQVVELERLFRDARLYADMLDASADTIEPDLRYEALRPYVRGQKPVLFRAGSYKAILEALQFAQELELKPIILGGRDAWKLADLLVERDVPVIYQGVFDLPGRIDTWDCNYRAMSVMADAGARFCLSFGDSELVKQMPIDAGFAVAHGLDPDAAVRAMTLSAAEILGVDDQYGSLAVGKRADVIVTTDHVCQATSRVTHAYIGGKPVSLESKHVLDARKFSHRPAPKLPAERTDLIGPKSLSMPPR
ncbi:MAG: amidohydrolase family protein [Phycisphaerales bacterium]|nr:amidohydrolase family protein [Phycisphaerales bacterium]